MSGTSDCLPTVGDGKAETGSCWCAVQCLVVKCFVSHERAKTPMSMIRRRGRGFGEHGGPDILE